MDPMGYDDLLTEILPISKQGAPPSIKPAIVSVGSCRLMGICRRNLKIQESYNTPLEHTLPDCERIPFIACW